MIINWQLIRVAVAQILEIGYKTKCHSDIYMGYLVFCKSFGIEIKMVYVFY